jgi:hypothetical protein
MFDKAVRMLRWRNRGPLGRKKSLGCAPGARETEKSGLPTLIQARTPIVKIGKKMKIIEMDIQLPTGD